MDTSAAFKRPASSISLVDAMRYSTVEYVVVTYALLIGGNLLTKLGGYDKNRVGAMKGSVGSLGMYNIRELVMLITN